MNDSQWHQFMEFAALFAETVNLDADEYNFKLGIAERMGSSRELFVAQDPSWFESLRKDLVASGLLNPYFMMKFVDAGRQHPEELWSVLAPVWGKAPDTRVLDALLQQLHPMNHKQFTVGSVTSLGSVLFMASDPYGHPPYRAQAVKNFLKLVGWDDRGAHDGSTRRYELFLESLDEILRLAPKYGIKLRDRLDAQGLMWTVMNVNPTDEWSPANSQAFRVWRGDKMAADVNSPISVTPEQTPARLLITGGLRGQASPLDGVTHTWTAEAAADLVDRQNTTKVDPGSFMSKLERQLAGASRETILLAAELLYLQVLPLSNVTAATKIARIEKVLSWAPGTKAELPEELRQGLQSEGAFNGGVGFNIQVADHVAWLSRFVEYAASQPQSLINSALADPWEFVGLTQSVPHDWPTIRYSIDFLAWPDHLQPVVSKDHRIKIRNAFAGIIGGPTGNSEIDIAKDLFAIRKAQQGDSDEFIEWYDEPYLSEWQPSDNPGRRGWLVRQNQGGVGMVDSWFGNHFVSLRAQHLGSPSPRSNFDEVQAAVNAGYQHIDYAERKVRAQEFYRFLSQMKVDDFVLTAFESNLYLGVITGEAEYADDETSRLRRQVTWRQEPIANDDLPAPMPRLLEEQGSVVDLTDALSIISAWSAAEPVVDGTTPETTAPPQPVVVPQLREANVDLATKLHVQRDDIQEIIRLLQTRQQIVFYGPPGTGKTYLAGKIARFLAGEEHGDHVKTVQFHPSYAYEDFFEGYRPATSDGGNVGFSLEPGPLRRIAAEASLDGNRDKPYFLIIDEMNRGNLAKIFGELYFLLEYRDQGINLQYNPQQTFVLPPNLFIIGTMNTADRSIAMVDAAIRRRFAFVELHPQEGMISGMLERFLKTTGQPALRADLLNALNSELGDTKRDLMVGPSYFMKEHAETDQGLAEIWKYELLPLLEEHYFGQMGREKIREKFGLAAIRRKASGDVGPNGDVSDLGNARA
ncbi:5-methylcytosine-specific restriction protein B [Paenarthrobacter sp. TE4293]|uniref:McrB family protein n=1 Tax=Paenarthrobacter sp. TE4293 TaxID=3381695 RepID=UPI003D1ECBCF